MLTAKGDDRVQVSVQHSKLMTAARAAEMKAYWGERLAALAQLLEDTMNPTDRAEG